MNERLTAQAPPLTDRFQTLYGQISRGFDPLHRDAFLDVKVTAAQDVTFLTQDISAELKA